MDQADEISEHVGALDEAALNVASAVKVTLSSNGQSGLNVLYDAAEGLEKILKQADIQVAQFTQRMHACLGLDDNGNRRRKKNQLLLELEGEYAKVEDDSAVSEAPRGQKEPEPKRRQSSTLESIFPKKVVEALKCDVGDDVAEYHQSVSVLMADIVGFTAWCSEVSPRKVIECLSAYFQVLDDIAESFGVYKVGSGVGPGALLLLLLRSRCRAGETTDWLSLFLAVHVAHRSVQLPPPPSSSSAERSRPWATATRRYAGRRCTVRTTRR